MTMDVKISVRVPAVRFLCCCLDKPRRAIAISYGNCFFFFFNYLRNHHTIFHRGFTIWHSHEELHKSSNFSTSSLSLVIILIIVNLVGTKWYLIMVLICISLIMVTVNIFYMFATHFYIKCKDITVHRFSFLDFFSTCKRHIRSLDINWVIKFLRGISVKAGNNFTGT